MAPMIVDATEVEPVKETSHEKLVENNVMHAARFNK